MKEEEELKLKEAERSLETVSLEPGILSLMPEHFTVDIADFLDARSLFRFSFTCKEYRALIISRSKLLF